MEGILFDMKFGARRAEDVLSKTPVSLPLVILFSLGVYFNALSAGLFLDDIPQLLKNPWIKDVRYLPEIFSSGVLGFENKIIDQYRPLMYVIYMMNFHIAGLAVWFFHLVNVLFHAGTSVLVFLIARRLFLEKETAYPYISSLMAGVFFAAHPIHTESVTWIGALPDVSYAFFFLLAFYLYISLTPAPLPLGEGKRVRELILYIASGAAFFLACLSKEPALTFPLILAAYDYLIRGKKRLSFYIKSYALYFIVIAVYFALRMNALEGLAPVRKHADLSAWQMALSVFPIFVQYFEKLLLPINLNTFYIFHPVLSLSEPRAFVSILLTVSIFISAYLIGRKNRLALFSFLIIVVPLLPSFYIPAFGVTVFGERYLYLPSFGFIMLMAMLVQYVLKRNERAFGVIALLLISVTALYSAGTVMRNRVWKDDYTIWADTVKKSPDGAIPRNHFGYALLTRGMIEEAIEHYEAAVRLDPAMHEAHANMGNAYSQKQEYARSIEHYRIAIGLRPAKAEYYYGLASAYDRMGSFNDAVENYKTALRMNPALIDAHLALGAAYGNKGMLALAIGEFEAALRLDPANGAARHNLNVALGMKRK